MVRIRVSSGRSIGEHFSSRLQNYLATMMEKNGWSHTSFSRKSEGVKSPKCVCTTESDQQHEFPVSQGFSSVMQISFIVHRHGLLPIFGNKFSMGCRTSPLKVVWCSIVSIDFYISRPSWSSNQISAILCTHCVYKYYFFNIIK